MTVFNNHIADLVFNIIIIGISITALWKGSDKMVDSASRIAARFGISDLVIGLTVVAIGSSAPEFAVTITAAFKGQADISVSNIVGSNIFNLGFILGSVVLIRELNTNSTLVYRDGVFMIVITAMLLLFFHDLFLSRVESTIMMATLTAYILFLLLKKKPVELRNISDDEQATNDEQATYKDVFILPGCICVIFAGGHYLVDSATFIARVAGISEWVIGVTIVAAGTSTPEMATSIAAAVKGRHGMSAGNVIGSDIYNILGVLGLAAFINPLQINPEGFKSLIMLCGMVVLVTIFMRTGWKLSRWEGGFLICIALARWIMDLTP